MEDSTSLLGIYVILRAASSFRVQQGHYPGTLPGQVDSDIDLLHTAVQSKISDWGINASINEDLVAEMCVGREGVGGMRMTGEGALTVFA